MVDVGIIIAIIICLLLIGTLTYLNRIDKNKFEKMMNANYKKTKDSEGDIELDE